MPMNSYFRSFIPILAATSLLLAAPASGAQLRKTKPQLPVQITIAPAQPGLAPDSIKPGDIVDLIVSAISFVDTDAMNITVAIPDGAVLISGDLSWTGPAKKGEKKTMPITVRVPKKGACEIKAEMSITIQGSKAFSSSSRYTLDGTKKAKAEQKRPVKKDSKGEDVIEYR